MKKSDMGEGVTNIDFFSDILFEWPLTGISNKRKGKATPRAQCRLCYLCKYLVGVKAMKSDKVLYYELFVNYSTVPNKWGVQIIEGLGKILKI